MSEAFFSDPAVRKTGLAAMCSIAMNTNPTTSEQPVNEQPEKSFTSAVRKLHPASISPTEMNTNLTITEQHDGRVVQRSEAIYDPAVRKLRPASISSTEMKTSFTTETGDERVNQQAEKVFEAAVRKTNQSTISTVKPMNTTKTISVSEQMWVNITPESVPCPTLTTRQQPHAGHVEVSIMNSETMVNDKGAATNRGRYGVGASNMIEMKDSTPERRKFRFKLKVKGLSFWAEAEMGSDQNWKVIWPWPKTVRFESDDERKVIEGQVVVKLNEAFSEFELATAA